MRRSYLSARDKYFGLYKSSEETGLFQKKQLSNLTFKIFITDVVEKKQVSFTFSSFEANKDSIPTFNLWYSMSNKQKQGSQVSS